MTNRLARAALFALVGLVGLAYWAVSDPSYDSVKTGWGWVLGFSAVLLVSGVGLSVYGSMVGGRWVVRLSTAAAAAFALGSVANVVEDGLEREWASWGFVVSTAAANVALVGMVIAIGWSGRGRERLLALVPLGALLLVVFYVPAGGPLMLVTWLAAAGVALTLSAPTAVLAGART